MRFPARLAYCLLVALLVVSLTAGAQLPPGGTFVDDNDSVHEGDIEAVAEADITRGCNPPANDRYCPDHPVTRAQMAAFLVRALDLTQSGQSDFTDVDGTFAADIDRLATAGITRGCNPPANDRYCPDEPVTRAQMAAFLVRGFDLTESEGVEFVDADGAFAADIDRLATAGITRGCNPPANDRYCPDHPVTRAQMATFLVRALGLDPISPPPDGPRVGAVPVPPEAELEDVSAPDTVIGSGTPASCTSEAVVKAVAEGGTIAFDCGPDPITIEMTETAQVFNDADPDVVIDGGGLVTLSGGDERRILYMNTCDPDLVWTTSHCNDQDHPRLTLQRLTFVDGNATGLDPDGGGAVFVRGGRLKVVDSAFYSNHCDATGPDVAGGAIRVFDQYRDLPVFVVRSAFGGPGNQGNSCSNGGGVASIGVSWSIFNSVFTGNRATGVGANPARSGTPGGGNGGAVYGDGNTFTTRIEGARIERNRANEGGGAVFFSSNDRSGDLVIEDSVLSANPSEGFETSGYPGIFFLGRSITVTRSVLD